MNYARIDSELAKSQTRLVAVSKTRTIEQIQALYDQGQRDFGENRVQELSEKAPVLPQDIRWHLIGHLQKNKVKFIADFIYLIQSVDSLQLLDQINKQAAKNDRIIPCLLQIKIADEDTKFGLDENELDALLRSEDYRQMENVEIRGLMGMATFTEDQEQVRREFARLRQLFDKTKAAHFDQAPFFREKSMGMSGDYRIAVEEGSTLVRIGSLLFED